MAISAQDRAWIEAHGGAVGVVSEQEAMQRELSWQARQALPRGVAAPARGPGGTYLDPTTGLPGEVTGAGLPLVGPAIGALGALGITIPPAIATLLGIGAVGYLGYQALGGGEGGGIGGINLFGGDEFTMGGLEFGGPGLPEPLAPYTEWHIGNKQFYYVKRYTTTGAFAGATVAMYNRDTKRWKVWKLPKPSLAIIGKNRPSHRMLTRLRRNLKRQTADAKTILKITQPSALESTRRPGGRFVKGRKRYID